MDQALTDSNRQATQRLRSVVTGLSEAELARQLPDGWTVAAALAHPAFWDLRAIHLMERWEREGLGASPVDDDAINEACLPLFRAVAPREAARLVVDAAEAIDRRIEIAPADLVEAIQAADADINVERANHRHEHLDQIEKALAG